MNVTIINQSTFSTESLQAIVDFLAPCFGETQMPVEVTFKSKVGHGTWGNAKYGDRAWAKRAVYKVTLFIGSTPRTTYPRLRVYKKRAGGFTARNLVDEIVHDLAHELRHVEQFDAARRQRAEDAKQPHSAPEGGANPTYWRSTWGFDSYFHWYEKRFASGSCEVDAEKVAHGLLAAYIYYIENVVVNERKAA